MDHEDTGASGGVDVTLVEATIRLTPEGRLRQNDRMLKALLELREAVRRTEDERSRDDRAG